MTAGIDLKSIKSLALAIVCGALAVWLFLTPVVQAWLAWGFAVLGLAYLVVGILQLRGARKPRIMKTR